MFCKLHPSTPDLWDLALQIGADREGTRKRSLGESLEGRVACSIYSTDRPSCQPLSPIAESHTIQGALTLVLGLVAPPPHTHTCTTPSLPQSLPLNVRDHPGQGSRYSVCRVWVPSSLSEVQACLPVLIRSSLSLLPFLLSTFFFLF